MRSGLHCCMSLLARGMDGLINGWMGFFRQVKWILRSSALLFCLTSDRSAHGATSRNAPCLSPSTKLTYSRLSAQILLHCRQCWRAALWLALHTVSPLCINGSLIAGPRRRLAVCCSSLLHTLPKYPQCGSELISRGFRVAGENDGRSEGVRKSPLKDSV